MKEIDQDILTTIEDKTSVYNVNSEVNPIYKTKETEQG